MIYLLIAYIVFLVGFVIYSAAGIYHLWRFGYVGDLTKPAIIIYLIISSVIIAFSILILFSYSWPANFSELLNSGGNF
jgi:ABC-type spermidine/putrescine transport system permease subunit II